ncbi:MAG TPA: M20 family metallopeptidase [Candidatus Limnocylindrales bacterium]|nr:M20 family metallopeptidase [Candidatus Limnocylindrales bacterium]
MDTSTAPGSGVDAAEMASIEAAAAAAEPEYLADLERLVNIDCGSYTPDGVDEVGRFVEAFLAGIGAGVTRHPDPAGRLGATVVGTIEGGDPAGPRLLLIGHMDTVFDPGTAAERPFRIEDGRAYGPGVTDMKSGLLTGLHGVRLLLGPAGGGGAPRESSFARITFVANPDEEIGSPASTPHIRAAAAEADACFVLECARANGDIVSARKGTLDLVATVHGRAAHAGVEPEKGRSAILEAARFIGDLHALNDRWPGVTVNVGVVAGGTRPNVVADRCTLEIDVRAGDAAAQDAAEAAIAELAAATEVPDTTIEVVRRARHRPMEKLERSGRLVEHVVTLGERLGFTVKDTATGGASDANTTSGMGVPTVDGLGPIGGNDHSPSEYLEVASIVPRTALFAALLLAVARDPVVRGWRG